MLNISVLNNLEIEDDISSSEDEEPLEEIEHDYSSGKTKLDMYLHGRYRLFLCFL